MTDFPVIKVGEDITRQVLSDHPEMMVGAGDNFVTPSDMVHGCLCLEPGTLIDYFTPRRDDFL